jgi:hypothetical protein
MKQTSYMWTAYIHYVDPDGYPWTEEFDVLADTYEAAYKKAASVMDAAYDPGGELELVQGIRVERDSIAASWAEVG